MAVDLARSSVRDWMTAEVPVITPQTTIATALRLLREHHVHALPVCAGTSLVGTVDEKALLRFTPSEATTLDVYELREVLDRLTVGRAATPARVTVAADQEIDDAAALLLRAGAEAVPVVDAGRFAGMLTWSAALRAMLERARPA